MKTLLEFQIAQLASPLHLVSLASGLFRATLIDPKILPAMLPTISKYFRIGQSAQFVFGFPLEDHWSSQLNEVRQMLQIDLEIQ